MLTVYHGGHLEEKGRTRLWTSILSEVQDSDGKPLADIGIDVQETTALPVEPMAGYY